MHFTHSKLGKAPETTEWNIHLFSVSAKDDPAMNIFESSVNGDGRYASATGVVVAGILFLGKGLLNGCLVIF